MILVVNTGPTDLSTRLLLNHFDTDNIDTEARLQAFRPLNQHANSDQAEFANLRLLLPVTAFILSLLSSCIVFGCPSTTSERTGSVVEPNVASENSSGIVSSASPTKSAHAEAFSRPSMTRPRKLDLAKYAWHGDRSLEPLPVYDDLLLRFQPPEGFSRVNVESNSFGAWLRRLPLADPSTPVVSYSGRTILVAGHPNLAAVATLDVGNANLQQCADAVVRLHAEWRWSVGARDMHYNAASGIGMPYRRWARGERVVLRGRSIAWLQRVAPSSSHQSFRKYLNAVFT
ncbi:MAG: hypothetical protein CSA75_04015 [Sorangium cellulosum]|nr:MAG: hypothetical protein CSA75_04015 [Sorangium cellulosum]